MPDKKRLSVIPFFRTSHEKSLNESILVRKYGIVIIKNTPSGLQFGKKLF